MRWRLIANTTVIGQGRESLTYVIHVDPIPLAPNGDDAERRSFYITSPEPVVLQETETGSLFLDYEDAVHEDFHIFLYAGTAVEHRFGLFGNPAVFDGKIQFSEGIDGACGDQHHTCEYWADRGECDSSRGFMWYRCSEICGQCLKSSSLSPSLSDVPTQSIYPTDAPTKSSSPTLFAEKCILVQTSGWNDASEGPINVYLLIVEMDIN